MQYFKPYQLNPVKHTYYSFLTACKHMMQFSVIHFSVQLSILSFPGEMILFLKHSLSSHLFLLHICRLTNSIQIQPDHQTSKDEALHFLSLALQKECCRPHGWPKAYSQIVQLRIKSSPGVQIWINNEVSQKKYLFPFIRPWLNQLAAVFF